jgi:hypothetical protein
MPTNWLNSLSQMPCSSSASVAHSSPEAVTEHFLSVLERYVPEKQNGGRRCNSRLWTLRLRYEFGFKVIVTTCLPAKDVNVLVDSLIHIARPNTNMIPGIVLKA